MKNLGLLLFLLIPLQLFSQSDTQRICVSEVVTLQLDTTWDHHIMESDLILYVEIQKGLFVTGGGSFYGNVLAVVKGEYSDSSFLIGLNLMEWSRTRAEKRLGAICPPFDRMKFPYKCYVGFLANRKLSNSQFLYDFITDPATKKKYYFLMSEQDLKAELKNYFFGRFWTKKLLPMYLRLTGN